MKDVLCFYHLPYGTDYPVVCMDASNKHRTRRDRAHQIKSMLDERYPKAIKVRLIMDNLEVIS